MRTAAYARFSSDQQRDASLEDQLRNCRAYCARMGWPAPIEFSDAAMSGARSDRPGYQRLLAQAPQFDVILVDDLSRLSRDSIEAQTVVKRLTFAGVRLLGVSDGVDTGRKGHGIEVGLRGIMSEVYLADLADKTHRGLTGRALAGSSAGGLSYGFRVTECGQRAIEPAQADVVRRIFSEYLAGRSPRQIASGLNADGIRSARGSTWAMTAIHGDQRRGIGILANPVYVGRWIWNRSQWVKNPANGRRVRKERPREEWLTSEHPELAIIDQATWNAVQARLRGQKKDSGTVGRPPRYLLSGILRCGECGGPMVAADRYRYCCSHAKTRGTCAGTLRPARRQAEAALIAGIQAELLSEAAFEQFRKDVAAQLKRLAPDQDTAKRRLGDAERIRENILAALRAGIITPSTKSELQAAEAGVLAAQGELERMRTIAPATILPRAREVWGRVVATLDEYTRNVPAARQALRELIGEKVTLRNDNGTLVAEIVPCQISMVAGAGFAPYLTGQTVRIPLQ